jgi:hypothetical protein
MNKFNSVSELLERYVLLDQLTTPGEHEQMLKEMEELEALIKKILEEVCYPVTYQSTCLDKPLVFYIIEGRNPDEYRVVYEPLILACTLDWPSDL